ncbi:unnamed protein product [Anisakis simplex]|uniref:Ovule protein n=1 Tax=Anisakis simplex TaxID=6269 RepID=A0A0M3JLQ7_ANISI|nr:unnamed protein product [Anisakis simplex]
MSCKPLLDEKKSSAVVSETAKADSNTNPLEDLIVPFDIGLQLSESELKAKRNLKLPYMAAQTQEGYFCNCSYLRFQLVL